MAEIKKIDGLDALKDLFPNENALIEHVIKSTIFFDKNLVSNYTSKIRMGIRTGEAIPVRFTSNGAFFLQHAVKTTTPSFKSRSEAIKFTNVAENKLFHRETKIRICFDLDGNYAPKRFIQDSTGYQVSCGKNSTIENYVIAHIWDKTDNPLYFSLPWNYVLMPCHCAYITDKRDDSNSIVKGVKDLIKALSIELYNPNHIMDWNQDVITDNDMPTKEACAEARKLIKAGEIRFLSQKESTLD